MRIPYYIPVSFETVVQFYRRELDEEGKPMEFMERTLTAKGWYYKSDDEFELAELLAPDGVPVDTSTVQWESIDDVRAQGASLGRELYDEKDYLI